MTIKLLTKSTASDNAAAKIAQEAATLAAKQENWEKLYNLKKMDAESRCNARATAIELKREQYQAKHEKLERAKSDKSRAAWWYIVVVGMTLAFPVVLMIAK